MDTLGTVTPRRWSRHPAPADLSKRWAELVETPAREAGYRPPKLVVMTSAYREFFGPLLDYIQQ